MSSTNTSDGYRNAFIARLGYEPAFIDLFNALKDVSFFLKNWNFELIYANRPFYARLGFQRESEIIGKQDFELFPELLAAKFRKDDEKVLATGDTMPELVELFLNKQGLPDWFITHKMAINDRQGEPIGIMGTVQPYDKAKGLKSSDPGIAKTVKRMLEAPGEILSVAELADDLGWTHRHFDRKFKEETGLTPKQFLNRARVQIACESLLKTDVHIATIAIELGYCDQSAFTAQFRSIMGITPLKYRKEFR